MGLIILLSFAALDGSDLGSLAPANYYNLDYAQHRNIKYATLRPRSDAFFLALGHRSVQNPSRFQMNAQGLLLSVITVWLSLIVLPFAAQATSNYDYKPDEYVTIVDGRSPDGHYAVAAHGEGDLGYDNFHIYLMDGQTGRRIGPLEEIRDTLDTGADAFYAKWSSDARQVSITYRVDRHVAMMIRYRIEHRRAYLISGPTQVEKMPND